MHKHLVALNRDRMYGSLPVPDSGTAGNVLREARRHVPDITVDDFIRRFIQCHWGRGQKPPKNAETWGLIVTLVKNGAWLNRARN
jgi:hypothetical protein